MVPFRLYLISDEQHYPGVLKTHLADILSVGSVGIQFREKGWSPRHQYEWIQQLLDHIPPHLPFHGRINDRADLALSLDLEGAHLREDSLLGAQWHPWLRQNLKFSVSTHSVEGVLAAEEAGADFVTLGPIFETPSKQAYGEPIGLDTLKKAAAQSNIPIFALGGIGVEQVVSCLQAGAYGVAAISAIWGSKDVVKKVQSFHYEILRGVSMRRVGAPPDEDSKTSEAH